ncbi:class I SAM-dependent methyltransferase [Aestuariivirga litoralis]|uniref:class I SAM-dependent methyltransferase n=1 Tax=Aestuariivirga litoralis TaxID=2650924 RepID=UPI0018C5E01A|nr:methyltransferase domain-containing protein [Aestuariivirga litoralis]
MPNPNRIVETCRKAVQPLVFLRQFVESPRAVGSFVPSGEHLAAAMVKGLAPCSGLVVELGPGTGVFTRRLLAMGIEPAHLMLVEFNPVFARRLRKEFLGVDVAEGDAADLDMMLAERGLDKAALILSSLPFRNLPAESASRIVMAMGRALAPGGTVVQFTYRLLPPIAPDDALRAGLAGRRQELVLANFPPAFVWHYDKRE